MRLELPIAARHAFAFSGLLLVVGAIVVSMLVFRAASVAKPDPNAEIAALTTSRAAVAATNLNAELSAISDLLERLAKSGGARVGGGKAMRLASKAFGQTKGLEQLAAYGPDGRTRWVMRPASRGRVLFPPKDDFIAAHLANPDRTLRLAAPFKPGSRSRYWTPVTHYAAGKSSRDTAVIVAFIRTDIFTKALAPAGDAAALFTDLGVLAAAQPADGAPMGVSFNASPAFRTAESAIADSGAFVGEKGAEIGPTPRVVVAFQKLDCCGAIVTSVANAAPPLPHDPKPVGRWLAIAAAGLMILLALALIGRKLLKDDAPDPWLDFGRKPTQPVV